MGIEVPLMQGKGFLQPLKPQGPLVEDQWALMAAAVLHEQGRLLEKPSFEDRAQATKDALKSGTFDPQGINSMKDFEADEKTTSEKYNTKLDPSEEAKFQVWKKKNMPSDSGMDYDQRGAFKAGAKAGKDGHWPDTWKKPNHPTFSNQSKYAIGADAELAGTWDGDTFIPPKRNMSLEVGGRKRTNSQDEETPEETNTALKARSRASSSAEDQRRDKFYDTEAMQSLLARTRAGRGPDYRNKK